MVKRRRTGGRNLAKGVFAFFWIVLAGLSGLYLFTLFTDPAALGGQTFQMSALTGPAESTSTGSAGAPAQAAMAPAAPASAQKSPLSASDLAELKQSLQTLAQQTAQLDARLKPIERFVGPVAALPPSASVTTSPPAPEEAPQTEADVAAPAPAALAEAEPEAPAAEEPVEEVVEETEVTEVEAEPEPAPEPAPAPQAAAEPEPEPAAAPPAPPEPPAVAATDAPAEDTEIAAFDPVTLPPAANDGSTRYGIEIGSVKSRDDLRPLWRELLTKHAALVAGLQPRRVKAPDNSWRLIAGPFANAEDAEGACSLFKKADRPCAATVYAGDAL